MFLSKLKTGGLLALAGLFVILNTNQVKAQESSFEETFVSGKVIELGDIQNKEDFVVEANTRQVTVQLDESLNGKKEIQIEQFINPNNPSDHLVLEIGDKVIVSQTQIGDQITYAIQDQYRLNSMIFFFLLFIGVVFVITGKKGIYALIGLGATLLILLGWVIPSIINGANPILIGFLGAVVIAIITFYLAHGFKKRTNLALMSTLLTLILAFILSILAVNGLQLFGTGSEDALSLTFLNPDLNLKGLLLGAIVIGTLGVLDDITVTQIATVHQLHEANLNFDFKELYKRALSVGKDHIASIINTLVLAYVGAAFPVLLLLIQSNRPLWVSVNSEFMAEEIVRTLVGSLTLVLAVPIATVFGAYFYSKKAARERSIL